MDSDGDEDWDWKPPLRAPKPPPPPNEWTWMSSILKAFAPDGVKDEPFIGKRMNSFAVQFQGQTKYNKRFKTLALAVARRDEKAYEFGMQEHVATNRTQNRLRHGKGDEDVRFASALEFLKTMSPDVYSSMAAEKNIRWNAHSRQWVVRTDVDGKQVHHGIFYMWQLADAVAKRDEARGYTNQERDDRNAAILAADPMYKDVQYAASNDGLKTWHKKHWTMNYMDDDRPHLVVKGTKAFCAACQDVGCDSAAQGDCRGGKPTVCHPHGGGRRCWGASGEKGGCPLDYMISNDKYDGMCMCCFCDLNPGHDLTLRAKASFHAKERAVRKFLVDTFPDCIWTFDKTFECPGFVGGRFSYRPDAQTRTRTVVLIIEVDEESHAGYPCDAERVREETFVAQAASMGQKVVVLRISPDGYNDEHGKYFAKCFKTSPDANGSFTCTVDPAQRKQWEGRLAKLAERVRFFLNTSNSVPPPQFGRPCYTEEFAYRDVAGNAAKKRSRVEM